MAQFIDETGNTYGRLVVLYQGESKLSSGKPTVRWVCRCSCGNITMVAGSSLRYGSSKSCGCLSSDTATVTHTKHGHSPSSGSTATYSVWEGMMSRCNCPTDKRYRAYGGAGILVCERWHNFTNFLADMGVRPVGLTLDRLDNSQGYYKENCRWATRMEQVLNRRNSVWITIDGVRKVLKHWCTDLGVVYTTALRKISQGLDPVEVLTSLSKQPPIS